MQGSLMSRKPDREMTDVQLTFDSVPGDSAELETTETRRKGTRVARRGQAKARKANRKAS